MLNSNFARNQERDYIYSIDTHTDLRKYSRTSQNVRHVEFARGRQEQGRVATGRQQQSGYHGSQRRSNRGERRWVEQQRQEDSDSGDSLYDNMERTIRVIALFLFIWMFLWYTFGHWIKLWHKIHLHDF